MNVTKIALYLRLSVDEVETDESNSITNQRYLLNHYLDQATEFKNWERLEFVDDGFSGTSLNRPSFQRLMAAVKVGTIRHILVKDLSRFMRDYLELGNYLENIFPFLGVRFIALNDHYDSLTSEQNGLDIDVPFRNLLNDFYAKDVSEKVKSAMNSMKRSGKNMSWLPPFGYLKDPEDRFKIIIDETVAPIVRRIFALYLDGNSYQTIARLLNEEQVITPAERKMQISQARYAKSLRLTTEQKRNVWSSTTVGQILKNEAYKGTYLFNTRTYVRGKHVFRPKSEWERIENNHEAIISSELFEQVVQLKESKATKRKQHQIPKTSSVLTGLIRCEHCDHSLIGHYNHQGYQYFSCRYCKGQGEKMKSCRVDRIEQAIKGKLGDEAVKPHQKVSKTLVLREIERLKTEKLACFQDYKDSLLTREDYIAKKKEVDKSVQALEEQIKEANCVQLPTDKKLSKEIVVAHVDKVVVDCLGFFTVIYK
ncbi:recombinase family protein [Streptococcus suis]|uniref:recombinase family protein n=1 Tax=Streptococcus suis TaxID=1307 RepID=UPI00209A8D91|nr:recombinase family protein [Streptococcus suis]MCO8230659.1 recombinase family protein [Streptococcus suis]